MPSNTGKVDHPIGGNRRSRGSRSKDKASASPADMLEGAAGALEKMKEIQEVEQTQQVESTVSKQSLSELKELLFFGRISEKVKLGGFIFEIRTLTNKQNNFLVSRLLNMDNDQRILNIKPYTLAEALVSINGVPLKDLIDSDDLDEYQQKVEVVTQMQASLVEKLFEKYEEINKKSSDIVRGDDLKENLKN